MGEPDTSSGAHAEGRDAGDVRLTRARALVARGRLDEAVGLLVGVAIEALEHGDDAHFDAALLEVAYGVTARPAGPPAIARIDELLARCRRAEVSAGAEPAARAAIAAAHLSAGDLGIASIHIRRVSAALPAGVAGFLCRWVGAMVDLAMGQVETARAGFAALVAAVPDTARPELRAELLGALGEAEVAAGDEAAGRATLEAALADPFVDDRRAARSHELLADLDRARGDWEAAYHHLEECRRLEAEVLLRPVRAAERRAAAAEPTREDAVGDDGRPSLEDLVDSKRRELEQALIDLRDLSGRTEVDPLTGLVNRARLRGRLAEMAQAQSVVSVLSIDVDRFGRVNESLGHEVGDQLLIEVARRIRRAVRPGDVVGRWGSDEFVVVLVGLVDDAQVLAVAEAVMAAVSTPWRTPGGDRLVPSVSIGVVAVPEGVTDGDQVLRQADAARQRAREQGLGRVEWFGDELSDVARRRFDTEVLLRDALSEGWFELYFQPVHPNATEAPLSAEALIRLHHPDGRLLAPGAFLDVAEDTGLARPMGEWVVDEAIRIAAGWARHRVPFRLALNVSASQLDDAFPELVVGALERHRLDPRTLILELTEHTLLEADQRQVGMILDLRSQGIGLALDDFGTAYSSLNHLRRFPVDVVKIDRSFIAGICHDAHDHAIVAAIVQLSMAFGFRVIAEGIETAEQLDAQRRLGCHGAQGYLIGRPKPADAFERLLSSRDLVGLLMRSA